MNFSNFFQISLGCTTSKLWVILRCITKPPTTDNQLTTDPPSVFLQIDRPTTHCLSFLQPSNRPPTTDPPTVSLIDQPTNHKLLTTYPPTTNLQTVLPTLWRYDLFCNFVTLGKFLHFVQFRIWISHYYMH